jgi:hypothetical protein
LASRDREAERKLLLDACRALARLVYEEYPEKYTLEEIARTWLNGVRDAELTALRRLPALLDPHDEGRG